MWVHKIFPLLQFLSICSIRSQVCIVSTSLYTNRSFDNSTDINNMIVISVECEYGRQSSIPLDSV